eukprot:358873-Chlamydomonas_euryale.AAC.1
MDDFCCGRMRAPPACSTRLESAAPLPGAACGASQSHAAAARLIAAAGALVAIVLVLARRSCSGCCCGDCSCGGCGAAGAGGATGQVCARLVELVLGLHDDADALGAAFPEHKARVGGDVFGALDEAEAHACAVAGAKALAVHRDDARGLANDLAVDDRLRARCAR